MLDISPFFGNEFELTPNFSFPGTYQVFDQNFILIGHMTTGWGFTPESPESIQRQIKELEERRRQQAHTDIAQP